MKRNILYTLIGCLILTLCACSNEYEDATSKHVYGEDENPYLKANANAIITEDVEFAVGHFETYTVNLAVYAERFQENMGMTLDQVISGLANGSVVFYNINTSKNCWNKAAMTKGTTGWYYNANGNVCAESDASQAVSLDLDTTTRTLKLNAKEGTAAGTLFGFNVGFAVNGPDYDKYVRFSFNTSFS